MNVVTAAAVQHQEKQGEVAVFDKDLEGGEWRIFRLFLVSLEDEDVKHVSKQLEKEQQARRDCENSSARLFFSSLAASDLTLGGCPSILQLRGSKQNRTGA
jgi:hypothetical protein